MTEHAWMLLPSGRQLDLLAPHRCAWTDRDLAVRLSRTYRWCSNTRWANPLSVAQHSLTVLHLRRAVAAQPLIPVEQLRELLHYAEEALANHDVPTMGFNYTAVDQTEDTTRSCIARGLCLVAVDGGQIAGTITVMPPGRAGSCVRRSGWRSRLGRRSWRSTPPRGPGT